MKLRGRMVGAAALVVAVAVVAAGFAMWRGHAAAAQRATTPKDWYTADDGKTWFADRDDRVVPFDHGGKPAYRCFVWTCDGGKTRFVSHLERPTAAGRQRAATATGGGSGAPAHALPMEMFPGTREVKRPLTGDQAWVPAESPRGVEIQNVRCPGGGPRPPAPVRAD